MSIITLSMYMAMLHDDDRQAHWAIPIAGMFFDVLIYAIYRVTT